MYQIGTLELFLWISREVMAVFIIAVKNINMETNKNTVTSESNSNRQCYCFFILGEVFCIIQYKVLLKGKMHYNCS